MFFHQDIEFQSYSLLCIIVIIHIIWCFDCIGVYSRNTPIRSKHYNGVANGTGIFLVTNLALTTTDAIKYPSGRFDQLCNQLIVVSTYTIIKIQQKDRSSSISRNKEATSHTLSRWWNTITTKQSNMKINQQQMESRRCGSKPINCYYRKKKKMGRKNTEKLGKQENETSKQQRKNSSESLCSKYTIYTDWQLIISNGERQQLNYQLTVIDTNNKAAEIDNE